MASTDPLLEEIASLLAGEGDRDDPARLERMLTDGYARVLSLEADRARVRRQVKHLASGVANQGAGTGEELSTLLQRLDAGAREVERLRSLLTSLRRRYSAALIR